MNCEFDQEILKERLDRSINGCGLSRMLSKLGITPEESVELIIKQDNNTIVKHKILLESNKVDVSNTEINFEEIMRKFLKQAESEYGLLSSLPKSDPCDDGRTKTPFTFVICRKVSVQALIICVDGVCDG